MLETIKRAPRLLVVLSFGYFLFLPCLFEMMVTTAHAAQTQASAGSSAQEQSNATLPRGKKLVMKDGSFQIVSSYQIQGDRVRYYSVERSDWEEIPAAMVDWNATNNAEKEESEHEKEIVEKVKAEEAAHRGAPLDVDASIEVFPGVFLPPGVGAFVLDGHSIFPLKQSQASSKLSKGKLIEKVLVPIPVVPSRRNVELAGAHADFRVKSADPEFYVRTTDPSEPIVELIKAREDGDKRHLENIDTLFSEQKEKRKSISMQEWRVATDVYRFTLSQPLKPGEYALAEYSPKEGMNLFVWDFGVDAPPPERTRKPKQ
jgi:hypothetical protein